MRLQLSMELLTLQKLDESAVSPTNNNLKSSATNPSLRNSLSSNSNNLNNNNSSNGSTGPAPEIKERMVQVTRQKVGGLGLSIKGGAEHKLPILISRCVSEEVILLFQPPNPSRLVSLAESTRTKQRTPLGNCSWATR